MKTGIIAIDIGGTKIAGALVSISGEIASWQSLPTEAEKGEGALTEKLIGLIEKLLKAQEGIKAVGIGIACAGLINAEEGVVISSPHLPWRQYSIKKGLSGFHLPVFVLNDANAAALGEHVFGAGKGVRDLIYITVSTGIGGGLIIGGMLYTGFLGTAGEVGHMTIEIDGLPCICGNRGCWETLASGSAISRMAEEKFNEKMDAQRVYEKALSGDESALGIIKKAGGYFGVGLANLINIFCPQLIIIGGGVSRMGEMFLEPAVKEMERRAYSLSAGRVELTLSELGEKAGIYGLVVYAKTFYDAKLFSP